MRMRRLFPYTAVGGPHTALIKSSGKSPVEIRIGQRLKYAPVLDRIDALNLNLRTITITTTHGTTINGVSINVTACCQVKIHAWAIDPSGELQFDKSAIRLAAQHFLERTDQQIDDCISKTVAGHQRAIIGALTVEELYRDRDTFSKRVSELCYQDMRNMGLCIVSYTVAEISDEQGYIQALGVTQTQIVKRKAVEGKALHENKARARKVKEQVDADIEINHQLNLKMDSDKAREIRQADAQRDIDRKVVVQEKARLITDAQEDTKLFVKRQKAKSAKVEGQLSVVRQEIEKERLVKEQTVHVEADALLYKATVDADSVRQTALAEAERVRVVGKAQADAEAAMIKECGSAQAHADAQYSYRNGIAEADVIRQKGLADADVRLAEAEAIKATSMAEAEVLRETLEIWNDFGSQGFIMDKIVEELPNIAGAIAAPLANTEKMVFIGCGGNDDDGSQIAEDAHEIDGHLDLVAGHRQNGYVHNTELLRIVS